MVTKEKLDEILDKKLKAVRDDVSDFRKDLKEDVSSLRVDLIDQLKILIESQMK